MREVNPNVTVKNHVHDLTIEADERDIEFGLLGDGYLDGRRKRAAEACIRNETEVISGSGPLA
jgi:hypothetical protein